MGDKEWDGPRTLYEMLNTDDEQIQKFVSDYKINIITPRDIKDFSLFSSDFRTVMEFMTKTQDKNTMNQYIHDNEDVFSMMDTDAALVLNTCTGLKLTINEKEEKVNMCKAWDDMREESRREGYKEAERDMCKAFVLYTKGKGDSRDIVISNLMSLFDLSKENAIAYYDSAVEKTA